MIADTIIKSKAVFDAIGDKPFDGSIAIKGNKIIAVKQGERMDKYMGPRTKVMDFGDKLVIPGMCDSHLHITESGAMESDYYLKGLDACTSEAAVLTKVKSFAEEHPNYPDISGIGYYVGNWDDPMTIPRKFSLDEIIPDRPVYLASFDLHGGWLNSKAVEECGLNGNGVKFKEQVEYDENGQATGSLFEKGWMYNGSEKLFSAPPEIEKEIRLNTLRNFNKFGITMVADMSGHVPGNVRNFERLLELEKNGKLTVRCSMSIGLQLNGDYAEQNQIAKMLEGSRLLRCNMAKALFDGVTPLHTAVLLDPYNDVPDTCGDPMWPVGEIKHGVLTANAEGYSCRIHCIGDGAVRAVLDIYEESEKINHCTERGIRNAIEHIETINPHDIERFGKIGVVAAMQPEHLPADYNDQKLRLGEERWQQGWRWKDIMNAGGHVCLGSDAPVSPANPFRGIYFAHTRKNYDGTPAGINGDNQKMTIAEALKGYTIEGAYALCREKETGTLEAGKLADVVVVDRDLFAIPPEEILDAKAIMTMVDGKIVYSL